MMVKLAVEALKRPMISSVLGGISFEGKNRRKRGGRIRIGKKSRMKKGGYGSCERKHAQLASRDYVVRMAYIRASRVSIGR